tara:strand:+ start:34882 stop:36075 length:1194 start_codon:yes stop_codon:yes gene_type:complete
MLHAVLKVVGGKQDGKLIPLNTKKFLIGREQDCHLRPSSESVSRHHCAITIDDYTVRVRDLGSSNGTSINGKRIIGVHEANPGDALQIGNLDFEIVFSKTGAPVTAGAPEKGGTSFTLDEFNLEAAEPLSDTAMMIGSDTAVISRKELEAQAAADQSAETATDSNEPAAATDSEAAPVETASDEAPSSPEPSAAEPPASEPAPVATEQPSPMDQEAPPQPAEVPAAAQQQPAFQQPAAPQMPGYGQQMPQQPYPYGMPGYGMPQQGYPYGMPQPGMPGYGMPQPGMPGYGMPGYGMPQPGMPGYGMPGYGMPQQGMPYPGQQMQYPGGQPVMDEYDDDDEDDEVEETESKIKEPPTSLPDPSETGLREVVKSDTDDGPKVEAPNPAAEILKKYRGGR